MRISDWSSDVCSSDLCSPTARARRPNKARSRLSLFEGQRDRAGAEARNRQVELALPQRRYISGADGAAQLFGRHVDAKIFALAIGPDKLPAEIRHHRVPLPLVAQDDLDAVLTRRKRVGTGRRGGLVIHLPSRTEARKRAG